MSTTAHDILRASFDDIGVLAAGEPLPAALAQDGLRRLNALVSGLQTQPDTSYAVVRYLFPLTSQQQTYTIGLGGAFDVPRPTVADVQGAGLLLQGLASPQAVTAITRTAQTATVIQVAHPFAVGDEAFIQGAHEIDYNGLQTVESVPTADTYTFAVNGLPTTPATGTITAAAIEGQPTEIPRTPIITDSGYAAIQLKNMPNAQFTNVYYNPTFPLGQIFLWPRPNTAINQLVLYLNTVFTQFDALHRAYDWPSLPGYAEMLQYQLDLRLAIPYGRPLEPRIHEMAAYTLGLVKRANTKLNDWPTDATILTHGRGGYNIDTDNFQGG